MYAVMKIVLDYVNKHLKRNISPEYKAALIELEGALKKVMRFN